MKNMKYGWAKKIRYIALAGALAVGCTALAGCGNDAEQAGTTDEAGVRTVSVWTQDRHSQDLMNQLAQEFNETTGKEKGIKIDYQVFSDDFANMIEMAHASGQAPDIHSTAGNTQMFSSKGWILQLSDLPGGQELIDKSKIYELRAATIRANDGKVSQIPTNVVTMKMVYNKDLFKKAGLVDETGEALVPLTWDDVVEFARVITEQGNGVEYGLVFPMKMDGFFTSEVITPFKASVGTNEWNFKEGKFDYAAFEPAFTEYLLKVKEDGSYVPGPEGMDNDSARALFAEGKVGMKISQSFDVAVFNDQFKAKCDWAVCDIPVLDLDNRYKEEAYISNGLLVTSKAQDALEKVMEVYKWYYSDDVRVALFENGKDIPYLEEVQAKATNVKDIKGWKEFSDLSKTYILKDRPWPAQDEGLTAEQVYMKIWMGEITPAEGLADLDNRVNAQFNREIEEGKYTLEDYYDPDYDISLD